MQRPNWINGKETYEDVPVREEHHCAIGRIVAGTEDWCLDCHPDMPMRETSPRLIEAQAWAATQAAIAESNFLAKAEGAES